MALTEPWFPFYLRPWERGWKAPFFMTFRGGAALIGTGMRLSLLLLFTGLALLVARRSVDAPPSAWPRIR